MSTLPTPPQRNTDRPAAVPAGTGDIARATADADAPYCSNCGYELRGLVDSSRCPECGLPLADVLVRRSNGWARLGKRYRSKATLFGLPVIDVAFGPSAREPRGWARGIIALGDVATGGIAVGGVSCGVVSIGGLSGGMLSLGGLSVGLLGAIGGLSVGGLTVGGAAVGALATGGGAIGIVAQGGVAVGFYARGAGAFGPNTISGGFSNTDTASVFNAFQWFFGAWPPTALSQLQPFGVIALAAFVVALLIGAICLWRLRDEGAGE